MKSTSIPGLTLTRFWTPWNSALSQPGPVSPVTLLGPAQGQMRGGWANLCRPCPRASCSPLPLDPFLPQQCSGGHVVMFSCSPPTWGLLEDRVCASQTLVPSSLCSSGMAKPQSKDKIQPTISSYRSRFIGTQVTHPFTFCLWLLFLHLQS